MHVSWYSDVKLHESGPWRRFFSDSRRLESACMVSLSGGVWLSVARSLTAPFGCSVA